MSITKSVFAAILLLASIASAQAQIFQSISTSGGNAAGSGGSASYSAGQFVYTLISTAGGTAQQGVQIVNLSNPLPIHLQSFSGACLNGQVSLVWRTATEINNDVFDVERSRDGKTWTGIAAIKGAGTTSTARSYAYTDREPDGLAAYYRLKQTDLNGSFTYSGTVYVLNCGSRQAPVTLYPNPAANGVYLNTGSLKNIRYELYNASGVLIQKAHITGLSTYIDLGKLPTNTYYLTVIQEDALLQTFKILKN